MMRLIGLVQREGKFDEAATLIDKTIKDNPKAVAPRLLAAQSLIERNLPLKVISMLSEIAGDNNDHPGLLLMIGRAQIAAEKAGEALGL